MRPCLCCPLLRPVQPSRGSNSLACHSAVRTVFELKTCGCSGVLTWQGCCTMLKVLHIDAEHPGLIGNSSNLLRKGGCAAPAWLAVADAAGASILGSNWEDVWHAVLAVFEM